MIVITDRSDGPPERREVDNVIDFLVERHKRSRLSKADDVLARALAILFKGDRPGHPFHGNQWTSRAKVLPALESFHDGSKLATMLHERGGFTLVPHSLRPTQSDGFSVAVAPKDGLIKKMDDLTAKDVDDWVRGHADQLAVPGRKIGGYHDTDNDVVYLDIVQVYGRKSEQKAHALAQKLGEQSIYDLKEGKVVFMPGMEGKLSAEAEKVLGKALARMWLFEPDADPAYIYATIKGGGITKHLGNKHDQKTHAGGRIMPVSPETGSGAVKKPGDPVELTAESFSPETNQKMADKLAKTLDGTTPEDVERHLRQVFAEATPEDIANGKKWYPEANKEAKKYAKEAGITVEQSAGVMAALSPGGEWGSNKTQAQQLMAFSKLHPEWTPAQVAVAAKVEHHWSISYGMDPYEKAVRIMRGETPDDVLRGPKVRSFYNNILDPKGKFDVTIDSHMINAGFGGTEKKGVSGVVLDIKKPKGAPKDWQPVQVPESGGVGRKGATTALTTGVSDGGRVLGVTTIYADIVRKIAAENGLLPSEAQAIMWVVQKRLHPPSEAKKATSMIQKATNAKYEVK